MTTVLDSQASTLEADSHAFDQPELPDPAARFLELFRRAMAGETVRWPALLRGLGQDESDRLGAMLLREFPQRVFPVDYAAVLSKAAGDKAAPPAPSVGRLRRVLLTIEEHDELWSGDQDRANQVFRRIGITSAALFDDVDEGYDRTLCCFVTLIGDESFPEVPLGSEVPWHERPAR